MENPRPSPQTWQGPRTDLAPGPGLEQSSTDHFLPEWHYSTCSNLSTLPAARSALLDPLTSISASVPLSPKPHQHGHPSSPLLFPDASSPSSLTSFSTHHSSSQACNQGLPSSRRQQGYSPGSFWGGEEVLEYLRRKVFESPCLDQAPCKTFRQI